MTTRSTRPSATSVPNADALTAGPNALPRARQPSPPRAANHSRATTPPTTTHPFPRLPVCPLRVMALTSSRRALARNHPKHDRPRYPEEE